MLLLLDENMDVRLEPLLAAEGLVALHVESLGLKSTPDPEVFRFAIENGYEALITKDAFRRISACICCRRCAMDCASSESGIRRRMP